MSTIHGKIEADLKRKPEAIPVGNVRAYKDALISTIFANYEVLNAILNRHQATISKRWHKRSEAKRRDLVLSAWGSKMAVNHRPDFNFW